VVANLGEGLPAFRRVDIGRANLQRLSVDQHVKRAGTRHCECRSLLHSMAFLVSINSNFMIYMALIYLARSLLQLPGVGRGPSTIRGLR
jgi:hypothetical protein